MTMNAYKGDIVVTRGAGKYMVVQTEPELLSLVNIADGNRWSDEKLEPKKENFRFYLTLDQINENYPTFCAISIIRNKDHEFYKEEIIKEQKQVKHLELERVIAHSMTKIMPDERQIFIVQRMAKDIIEFLKEKKISE